MSPRERLTIINRGNGREPVASLAPHLAASLIAGHRMAAERMRDDERADCRWIGFGIGKGVTHPRFGITVFAVPKDLASGLHGELIQGFDGIAVDQTPACYEPDADPGFGGFVRWVLLADPDRKCDVLGIDFSLALADRGGVANSMLTVAEISEIVMSQGIPGDTEVALLNCRMCEPSELKNWRLTNDLVTLHDWSLSRLRFQPGSAQCPRCGMPTLGDSSVRFCFRCGCRPPLIWSRHEYPTT